METVIVTAFFFICIFYEWKTGNLKKEIISPTDWKMIAICSVGIALVQRPLVMTLIFMLCGVLIAPLADILKPYESQYFWPLLITFILLEEFFHGFGHWLSHSRTLETRWLRPIQKLFKTAHRPHHLIGNDDENAKLTVGQTFVEGWMYLFLMPNIWFSFIALYLGLVHVFLVGMVFKGLWALHVHTNWNYDLYFLNHKNKFIRKIAFVLAHVFTFPTMHQHHHSRGPNSAKNLHNFLSLYDWLIYKTLKIETSAPERFGWRQNDEEKNSALHRFTRTY